MNVSYLFIAGLFQIGLAIISFVLLRRYINRYLLKRDYLKEIREQVAELIIELNGTTDRNISLMENQIYQVKRILDIVDKKVGVLNNEIRKFESTTSVLEKLNNSNSKATNSKISKDNTLEARINIGAKNDPANRREEINRLHQLGLSNIKIAERLAANLGEVELIVNIDGNKQNN